MSPTTRVFFAPNEGLHSDWVWVRTCSKVGTLPPSTWRIVRCAIAATDFLPLEAEEALRRDPVFGCDPDGSGGGGGGFCSAENEDCDPNCQPFGCDLGFGGGGLTGGGGQPPTGPANGGGTHGPWANNETLGLPQGLNLAPQSLAGLLGIDPSGTCDFGVCAPIGEGFGPGEVAVAAGDAVTAAQLILTGALALLSTQTGDADPCVHQPGGCNEECVPTGAAKEGNTLQCWYSCPKPGGQEVIKWQWAKDGKCPGFAMENDLRALMKKMNDIDLDLDAAVYSTHAGGHCDEIFECSKGSAR